MSHLSRLSYRSRRYQAFVGLLLVGVLALAACSTGGNGGGGGGGGNGNGPGGNGAAGSPTAAATAKPKPTGAPTLTLELCTHLMSLAEANTLIQPKTSVSTIVPTNGDNGGACNYEASKSNIPLIIYFFDWTGPNPPIPQSDIDAILSEAAGTDITITKAIPVTGVGDQAEYVEVTGSSQGFTATAHVFYVIYGKLFFDCVTYSYLSGGTMTTQSQLQQCAAQVVDRL
jgi:hypothetical protein